MNKEFIAALDELERERNIPKAQILDAVSRALISAYKGKNKMNEENVIVEIDDKTGEIDVLRRKMVVAEVEDEDTQVSLAEMHEYDDSYEIGDVADFPFPIEDFTRIAAQTAKQVVVQAIRDAERAKVFEEYKNRQGELITGTIQRVGGGAVYVTLGRTEGVLQVNEQVRGERYPANNRMKFYIIEVRDSEKRGPQIFLSRTHPNLVRKLFELEVPEIREGIVSIESLAREAGSRTKMAVLSSDESVDPVGACVGNRGNRVQAVVDELNDEKIDIIPWSTEIEGNIKNALAPAAVEKIIFDEAEKRSTAVVPDFQLSLAIGKEGQNVRLAAKLCGVKIDIKSHSQYYGANEELLEVPDATLDEDGYYIVPEHVEEGHEASGEDGGEPTDGDADVVAEAAGDAEVVAEAAGDADGAADATGVAGAADTATGAEKAKAVKAEAKAEAGSTDAEPGKVKAKATDEADEATGADKTKTAKTKAKTGAGSTDAEPGKVKAKATDVADEATGAEKEKAGKAEAKAEAGATDAELGKAKATDVADEATGADKTKAAKTKAKTGAGATDAEPEVTEAAGDADGVAEAADVPGADKAKAAKTKAKADAGATDGEPGNPEADAEPGKAKAKAKAGAADAEPGKATDAEPVNPEVADGADTKEGMETDA